MYEQELRVGQDREVNSQVIQQVNNRLQDYRPGYKRFNLYIQEDGTYRKAPTRDLVGSVTAARGRCLKEIINRAVFLYDPEFMGNRARRERQLCHIPLVGWCKWGIAGAQAYLGGSYMEPLWRGNDPYIYLSSYYNDPPRGAEMDFYKRGLKLHQQCVSDRGRVITIDDYRPIFGPALKNAIDHPPGFPLEVEQDIKAELKAYRWIFDYWCQHGPDLQNLCSVVDRCLRSSGQNLVVLDSTHGPDVNYDEFVRKYRDMTVDKIVEALTLHQYTTPDANPEGWWSPETW